MYFGVNIGLGKHREVTFTNLRIKFPSLSDAEACAQQWDVWDVYRLG